MSQRRGRERRRAPRQPHCLTFTSGAFWVSFDRDTGEMIASGQDSVEAGERDRITLAVLNLLGGAGWWRDPLEVRDAIWG